MKTLNLHVDYIEWEGLKKALKNIDELSSNQDPSKKRVEEALVVLTAIEKGDSLESVEEYVKNLARNLFVNKIACKASHNHNGDHPNYNNQQVRCQ